MSEEATVLKYHDLFQKLYFQLLKVSVFLKWVHDDPLSLCDEKQSELLGKPPLP